MQCYACGRRVPYEAVCSEECAEKMRKSLIADMGSPSVSESNFVRAERMLRKLDTLPVIPAPGKKTADV